MDPGPKIPAETAQRSPRRFSWLLPARLEGLLAAIAPALLAGFHVTGLLYFLNPHLTLSARGFGEGIVRLGLLFVPFALASQALSTRLRNVRVRRLLPWSLTVVLGAAALADWVHASHYSFYLPTGINANLIRTALWLSFGTVLAFYTSLLHTLHHRRYGLRSLVLLVAVVVGSLYVVVARRLAYEPAVALESAFAQPASGPAPHLLVVGLEGATLDLLLPLARQGRLPFFASCFDEGSYARLESFPPVRPLGLWASVASGKLPFRHALAGPTLIEAPWLGASTGRGELRLLPLGFSGLGLDRLLGEHRPLARSDRKARTVWEILGQLDRPSAVLGAPEALLSATVGIAQASDDLFRGVPGASPALPESFAGRLELLRGEARSADTHAEASAGAARDPLQSHLAVLRAQDRWRAAVAASLLGDSKPPAAVFLDLPGLLEVELLTVGGFHSAEMNGSRAGADRRAAAALTDYMAFLDSTLADLWQRLPEPRFLAVVSAYGAAPPEGLRRVLAEIWRARRTSGTLADGPDGALLLRGEGVRRGEGLATARIVDLVPTLLYVSRLPIARDFDGRVLTEAFEPALLQGVPLTFLQSYEELTPP
ncbi:MAG: hypothetical protein ABIV06_08960 [Thermoanaerobaculia bacterium]